MVRFYRHSLTKLQNNITLTFSKKVSVTVICTFILYSVIGTTVYAHGGVDMDRDTCSFSAEGHKIHFSAYQPALTQTKELCNKVSATTDTILVLDFVDEALRSIPMELLIEREDAGQYVSFKNVAEALYPSGTTKIDLNNIAVGDYRLSANLLASQQHSHTKASHRTAHFDFKVISKDLAQGGLFSRYSWIFYIIGLGMLAYFLSSKFSRK